MPRGRERRSTTRRSLEGRLELTQRLGAMNVSKARRVGDDGVCCEGLSGDGVGLVACLPTAVEDLQEEPKSARADDLGAGTAHLANHLPLLGNVTFPERVEARKEPRILDLSSPRRQGALKSPTSAKPGTHHVRHQLRWISSDVEELDPLLQHELLKCSVCAETNSVALLLQAMGERDEGLDVAC